jgi:translocation and assembly module TamA
MRRTAQHGAALVLLGAAVQAGAAEVSVTLAAPELTAEQRAGVRGALAIAREERDVTPARIRRLHRLAEQQIRTALEAYGYYRPEVRAGLAVTGERFRARYRVEPGPPLPVGALEVRVLGSGRDDPALATARRFPLQPGDRLDHAAYERGKEALARAALEHGYLDARFLVHRVEVDLGTYRARVVLDFDTGPRYRVGVVRFAPTVVGEPLLRRFVPFGPGAPYSAADVLALQSALADSPYFSAADVRTIPRAGPPAQVDLEVSLDARKRSLYRLGGGFATDTGPRGVAGYERRYVNRRGHRIKSELRASPVDSALTGTYAIPRGNPATDAYELGVAAKRIDTDTARADSLAFGLARTGTRRGWREALGLDWLLESFTTGEDEGTSVLLMPSLRWDRVDAANPVRPRRGRRLHLALRGASAALGSSTDLVQARVSGKQVLSLSARQRLLLRADAGASWTGSFEDIPPSLRFYAGGDQSVRGYDLNALGPEDEEGDVIGGRHLAVASAEYELQVRRDWALAVFYDAGNAFDTDEARLARGAGLGVRWLSPVGPLRVDLASALSEPGTPLRLHLTLGPDM